MSIGRLDRILSSPNRILYLCNAIAIFGLAWAIRGGSISMIAVYGIFLFVYNYPWFRSKYHQLKWKLRS